MKIFVHVFLSRKRHWWCVRTSSLAVSFSLSIWVCVRTRHVSSCTRRVWSASNAVSLASWFSWDSRASLDICRERKLHRQTHDALNITLTLQTPSVQRPGSVMTHTHTHPFNGSFSGTTRVSWYQKGKTNLDFTDARDSEWQWHQLSRMQVCTSLQTDNHSVFYRSDALPAA